MEIQCYILSDRMISSEAMISYKSPPSSAAGHWERMTSNANVAPHHAGRWERMTSNANVSTHHAPRFVCVHPTTTTTFAWKWQKSNVSFLVIPRKYASSFPTSYHSSVSLAARQPSIPRPSTLETSLQKL